eukprot:TRINITY_DN5931_c3_g1_i2.p1 TRINITY_DN5931_c3_g1~~TRINITY_DN5931_c3_g1_i2.p1  ORF type:complete len:811 (+),score=180.81 TRINITY_DN5931_c3_g1_i2:146-2578(+)
MRRGGRGGRGGGKVEMAHARAPGKQRLDLVHQGKVEMAPAVKVSMTLAPSENDSKQTRRVNAKTPGPEPRQADTASVVSSRGSARGGRRSCTTASSSDGATSMTFQAKSPTAAASESGSSGAASRMRNSDADGCSDGALGSKRAERMARECTSRATAHSQWPVQGPANIVKGQGIFCYHSGWKYGPDSLDNAGLHMRWQRKAPRQEKLSDAPLVCRTSAVSLEPPPPPAQPPPPQPAPPPSAPAPEPPAPAPQTPIEPPSPPLLATEPPTPPTEPQPSPPAEPVPGCQLDPPPWRPQPSGGALPSWGSPSSPPRPSPPPPSPAPEEAVAPPSPRPASPAAPTVGGSGDGPCTALPLPLPLPAVLGLLQAACGPAALRAPGSCSGSSTGATDAVAGLSQLCSAADSDAGRATPPSHGAAPQPWFGEALEGELQRITALFELTPEEQVVRERVASNVKQVINKTLTSGNCSPNVEVYGSWAAGLALPSSDIDIAVSSCTATPHLLGSVAREVEQQLGMRCTLQLPKAAVPLLKFVHSPTGIICDVAFNIQRGAESVKTIQDLVEIHSESHARQLILVLKLFVHAAGLNEVFRGGLCSYGLHLMVCAFLRREREAGGSTALADLFVGLLCYYGTGGGFDPARRTVDCGCPGGVEDAVMPARDHRARESGKHWCVRDPLNPGKNVTEAGFRVHEVADMLGSIARALAAAAERGPPPPAEGAAAVCPMLAAAVDACGRVPAGELQGRVFRRASQLQAGSVDSRYGLPPLPVLNPVTPTLVRVIAHPAHPSQRFQPPILMPLAQCPDQFLGRAHRM